MIFQLQVRIWYLKKLSHKMWRSNRYTVSPYTHKYATVCGQGYDTLQLTATLLSNALAWGTYSWGSKGSLLSSMWYVYIYIYIYICIYLFISLSGSMVQSTIVYGVHLFTMPGMQCVVYSKSLQVLTATSCSLLITMNRIKLSITLKRFLINVAIE